MKKVLFITTSADKMAENNTGVWLEELTAPYFVLLDGGVSVDVASVKGGKIPFDPRALEDEYITDSVKRFLADDNTKALLENSGKYSDKNFEDYDAIFFPGGHGAMIDLPNEEKLAEDLGKFFDNGKIVASICHGPAGLVSAKSANGKYIVNGYKFTCFSNDEEEAIGVTEKVPFLLQSKLEEQGGIFVKKENFSENVVVDRNFITGQNPASSEMIGKEILKLLIKG